MSPFKRPTSLPPGLAARIDAVGDRFEHEWLSDTAPRLEDFLPLVDEADRPALLCHLLEVELHYRARRGERATAEDYLQRLPEYATLIVSALPEMPELTGTVDGRPDTASPQPTTSSPGNSRIPGYEILEELGRGGMGVVYKARQLKANRVVALKMLLAGTYAGPSERLRFQTEAEAVARLQYPNIVQVHEVGEHDGHPFFSMEYCAGGALDKKLAGTPLQPTEAAKLIETLARAMHAAHQQQVIHRDLKPANVLLTQDGTPKITDFGLAKKLDELGQTQSGAVMGTPSYMAPEQAGGKTKELGAPADIYALGAMLYECLTGRPPFKAASELDTILLVVREEPASPRQLNAKVPLDLETICLKCLAKSASGRYATASTLADDLHRFLVGEPIVARPVTTVERFWRWCRRKPAFAAASTAAALGMVLAVVTFGVAFFMVSQSRDDAIDSAGKEYQQRVRAEKLAIDNGLLAKQADERRRDAEKLAQDNDRLAKEADDGRRRAEKPVLQTRFDYLYFRSREEPTLAMFESVQLLAEAIKLKDQSLVDSVMLHLGVWSQEVHKLRAVWSHQNKIEAVAFSPDGKTVLTAGGDEVRLWETATGKPFGPPLQHQGRVTAAGFSPDGKMVLTGSCDQTARLWDTAAGKPLGPPLQHQADVRFLAFSPNGKTVLTGSNDKTARLWETATGTPIGPPVLNQGGLGPVAFSPDGKTVLTVEACAQMWETATGKLLGPPIGGSARVAALSPDGKRVLTGSNDDTARLWDTATGKPLGPPMVHQNRVVAVAFSPDGETLLTGSCENTARLWAAATCKQLGPSLQHQNGLKAVAFSPDGKTVVTGGVDGARLWEAATGRQLGPPIHQQVMVVAFSPDGKTVLTGSFDKTARLWEAATGKQFGPSLHHQNRVAFVAFCQNGKTVLTGTADRKGEAQVWELATGKKVGPPLHRGILFAVALSPDGKTVLTASNDKTARLWETKTGKQLGPSLQHQDMVTAVAFSPDGKTVLTGSGDTTARLWKTATGNQIGPPLPHRYQISAVAFSPDGKTVLGGSGPNSSPLWEVATGKPLGSPLQHQDTVLAAVFSPDSKIVLTGSIDKTARLWDATTGKPVGQPLKHQSLVWVAAFSPDGKMALTGSSDKTARLWDTATSKQIGPPLQHQNEVKAVAFSPNGKTVLTASIDNTARLWEAATGKSLGRPLPHHAPVVAVAVSPDSRTVLTGSSDKTARLWRVAQIHGNLDEVRLWVQVITGLELDEYGLLRHLDAQTWHERRRLQELGGLKEE